MFSRGNALAVSDIRLRELERRATSDPAARIELQNEWARLGRGWAGEELPPGLVRESERGVYRFLKTLPSVTDRLVEMAEARGFSPMPTTTAVIDKLLVIAPDRGQGEARLRMLPESIRRLARVVTKSGDLVGIAHARYLVVGNPNEGRRTLGIELVRVEGAGEIQQFYLGRFPIMDYQADQWATDVGRSEFEFGALSFPAIDVSFDDARSFCEWAGLRLPCAIERRWAATGPEMPPFPWGNAEPTLAHAVFGAWTLQPCVEATIRGIATVILPRRPAGRAWCGAHDLAGNVWEWIDASDGQVMGGSHRTPWEDVQRALSHPVLASDRLEAVMEDFRDVGFRVAL